MTAIHIHRRIDSDTLQLPELRPLVGKMVEIIITEVSPATREEFYGEAAQIPRTPEEEAAQQEKFRAWRSDPRFERFWPVLDRWLGGETPRPTGGDAEPREEAAS
jgi:hypothetical protein